MTVYVDDMRLPARVGRYQARWSHLTADTTHELHASAVAIGLCWSRFQAKPNGAWHYDVTDRKRVEAIAAGAVAIAWRDFHAVCTRPGRKGRSRQHSGRGSS